MKNDSYSPIVPSIGMPSPGHLVITDFDFEPAWPLQVELSTNEEDEDRRLIRFSYPSRNHRRKQQRYIHTHKPPEPVSVFEKTPQEHVEAAVNEKLERSLLPPHIIHGTQSPDPPGDGCIHLLFWTSLERMKQLKADPDLFAEVYLEPQGTLDLKQVAATWGLENVAVIDPLRERLFEPGDRHWLSAIAVQNLAINGKTLLLTERPSDTTVATRERRKEYFDNPIFELWNWLISEKATHSRFDELSHRRHDNTLIQNIGVTLTITHRWFTKQSNEQPPTWIQNICTGVCMLIVAIFMLLVVHQDFYNWDGNQELYY